MDYRYWEAYFLNTNGEKDYYTIRTPEYYDSDNVIRLLHKELSSEEIENLYIKEVADSGDIFDLDYVDN